MRAINDDPRYPRHEESRALVPAPPDEVFAFLDDHTQLAAHMSERSWMMARGWMSVRTDAGAGRRVGSRITLTGRVLGASLGVESVVTDRVPPLHKAWETVAEPRLLVIGRYRMGFDLEPADGDTRLRVFIDYALPERELPWLLGLLLAPSYARWCVREMVRDARSHFATPLGAAAPLPAHATTP